MPASDALPDLSGLLELSRIEQLDLKPVVLRVQTDLYLRAPPPGPAVRETFTSLACGLIPTVDQETLRVVAEKLATHPETPPAVLEALAARGIIAPPAAADADPAEDAPMPAMLTARLASLPSLRREAIEDLSRDGRPEVDLALALNRGSSWGASPCAAWSAGPARCRSRPCHPRPAGSRGGGPRTALSPPIRHARGHRPRRRATAGLRPCPPVPRGLGAALTALSTDGTCRPSSRRWRPPSACRPTS